MKYDCSSRTFVPDLVIVLIKVFVDTRELVIVIGVGFGCKNNGIFPPMSVNKEGFPSIKLAFEVYLSNRISLNWILICRVCGCISGVLFRFSPRIVFVCYGGCWVGVFVVFAWSRSSPRSSWNYRCDTQVGIWRVDTNSGRPKTSPRLSCGVQFGLLGVRFNTFYIR